MVAVAGAHQWPLEKFNDRLSTRARGLPASAHARQSPAVVLLCGAFSPVHRGQVAAARYALAGLEARGFGAIGSWINPASDADCVGRKTAIASWQLRLYLARCAVSDCPDVECSWWCPREKFVGDWSYNNGAAVYRIALTDGQYVFTEQTQSVVLALCEQWLQGDLAHGTIRLQPKEDGTLFSQFRMKGEGLWGAPTIAYKKAAVPSTPATTKKSQVEISTPVANFETLWNDAVSNQRVVMSSPDSPPSLRGRKPPSPIMEDSVMSMGTGGFPAISPSAFTAFTPGNSQVDIGTSLLQAAPIVLTPPRATLGSAVRSLQTAICSSYPDLQGNVHVFLLCDASTAQGMRGEFVAKERQGMIVVLRPGETPPLFGDGELAIVLDPMSGPVQHFSGDVARAVLYTGDDATTRQILPEIVARVFLNPSSDERAAFSKELAKFLPPQTATDLNKFAAAQEVEASKPLREKLRTWLTSHYGSASRGFRSFDTDLSGTISAQEVSRVARQAGVTEHEVPLLLRGLGLAHGACLKVDDLCVRLDGVLQPQQSQEMEGAAQNLAASFHQIAQTSILEMSSMLKFAELAKEIVKMQQEVKVTLFKLFEPASYSRKADDRQNEALVLVADTGWQQIFSLKDDHGSSLLLLAAKDGMHWLCAKILNFEQRSGESTNRSNVAQWIPLPDGPSLEERSAYANRSNDMGWTALTMAAQNGFHSVCEVLLAAHADPNIPTSGTRLTPLMLAASNGHLETVTRLLDLVSTRPFALRANPWQTSSDGRTALDFTRERIHYRRLASDTQGIETNVWDSYGVRQPHLAEAPEPYSDIGRILTQLTGQVADGSSYLGVLRQDMVLEIGEGVFVQNGMLRRGAPGRGSLPDGVLPGGANFSGDTKFGIRREARHNQIIGPRYIDRLASNRMSFR